jgi:hypothetical protein
MQAEKLWCRNPPQPQVNSKKSTQTDIKLQRQPSSKNTKSHAEKAPTHIHRQSDTAIETKLKLKPTADKVGYSKPRQLLTKQKIGFAQVNY